jgi:hypothetical protein
MKTVRLIRSCLVLSILVVWASSAWAADFVNLVQHTEKWFVSEGASPCKPLKMHTVVNGFHRGATILHRETHQAGATLAMEDLLYSRNQSGDIFFHGDLQKTVFAEPILWISAPLAVGKTWTDSRLDTGINVTADARVHYVFAVLEEKDIACPAGTFACYRVYVAEISPDGQTKNSTFWYNKQCGMIMCAIENAQVLSLKKTFVGAGGVPDYERRDGTEIVDLSGLAVGPNPSNPMTRISFDLLRPARVEAGVYDIAGRLIKRLIAGEFQPAGPVSVRWPGTDDAGRSVASGTYIVRVQAGQTVQSQRVSLVR